jgi:hypothetical protein
MTSRRFFFLAALCVLSAGANYFLNALFIYALKIPLFLDTVFSAAVCFSAGLIPGLITALLSNLAASLRDGGFSPFIVCGFAEVIIVWLLNPLAHQRKRAGKEKPVFFSSFAGLLLLYITACLAVSVLGGVIDYVYYYLMSVEKQYFSAEDTVKINLLQSGIPILVMNILSRIPVNVVDRFIVIFGGFGISLLYRKLENLKNNDGYKYLPLRGAD